MMLLFVILSLSPVKDFRYARGLFNDGLYDLAEVELSHFLERYPNSIYSPEASILLLNSLNQQGSFEKTIQRARRLLSKYPGKKEEIILLWGKAELGLGNNDNAIGVFKRLSNVDLRELWIGETFFNLGRYKEALKHYLKSNLPYSKLIAGWCYMKMEDYDKASSIFVSLGGEYEEEGKFLYAKALYLKGDEGSVDGFFTYLKRFPKGKYRGRSYALLSDIYLDRGDTETAILYLKDVIQEEPTLMGYALYKIGVIHYEESNYELAIESFNKVEVSDPYWWDALYWKALSEMKIGMTEEASTHLKEVASNSKELSQEALFELGSLYDKMCEYEKAISVLRKVKGELKDEAGIAIGNVFLKMGRFKEASLEFMKVIEKGEDNVSLAFLQAAVSEKKDGNEEKALALLDSYEKRFPHGEEINRIRLLKADIYLNQSKYRMAIEEYEKVSGEEAGDFIPYVLEGRAWAYVGLKRYDLAFLTLEKLSDEFPDFCTRPELYLQLGNAAYAMGNFSEAEKAYQQVKGELRPKAMFLLGRMLFEKENYNDAIRVFDEIRNQFSLSEYSSLATYYIAFSLRKKQDLTASNKRLYSIVSEVQDKEVLYKSFLLLGDNYFDQALYDSSLKYYERGFDLVYGKPLLEGVELNLLSTIRGILLSINASSGSSSMENKARDLIRRLKGTEDEAKINLIVGNILYNSGKYDRALDYLEESDSPTSLYNAGMAYLKLGREEEAIQFLRKAAVGKGISDKAYLELGKIFFDRGAFGKAKEYFSRSSSGEASLLYALALYKEGNRGDAISKLDELKGKVEGLAYLELAKIQIDSERCEVAFDNLKKAIEYEGAAPEAYYLMGKLLLKEGKQDEAFKVLLKVKYIYPESDWVSPALMLLSEISFRNGDTSRAIKYLEEIIERGEKEWTERAKKRISEIK